MKTFEGNIFTRNTFTDLVHVSEPCTTVIKIFKAKTVKKSEPCTTVIKIFKAKTLKQLVEEQTNQRGFG